MENAFWEVLIGSICIEAFITIHMTIFVLLPLSKLLSKTDDSKSLFWKLFIGRIIFLLIFNFILPGVTAGIDFILVFIGAFIVVPIVSLSKRKNIDYSFGNSKNNNISSAAIVTANNQLYTCEGCGAKFNISEKFCPYCKKNVNLNNTITSTLSQKIVTPESYEPMFSFSEKKMIDKFITDALAKSDISIKSKLLPRDLIKRKNILSIIFYILIFTFISSIFFHFPIVTYIIFLIILIVSFVLLSKYNLVSYLRKEIKARPSEKIQNIISSVKSNSVVDSFGIIRKIILVGCIILPLIIFYNPRIMYEKNNDGYSVRFYTFGLNNFTSAVIPDKHNNQPVTSLRGNTFSNMPLLKKVTLPDSITEIRGQAFKNDIILEKVNIPSKLEYLGGGAFYNCHSIENVELPDTLIYMGGEVFYHASSLKSIKLSNNITEIRGNSFEECTSLEEIEIPDSVTRIGGHAFYGDSKLSKVKFTENSSLTEIGSSAFRLCSSLRTIRIPDNVYVNERAFKESPTIVKHFSDSDAEIDYYKYEYTTYHTFSYTGDTFDFDKYYNENNSNGILTFVGYTKLSGLYKYEFEYKNGSNIERFYLDYYQQTYSIGEDLLITISNPYIFSSFNGNVDLTLYFN